MGFCDDPPCLECVPSSGSACGLPTGFRGGGLLFLVLLRSLSDVGVVGMTIALATASSLPALPSTTAPSFVPFEAFSFVPFDAFSFVPFDAFSVSTLIGGSEGETVLVATGGERTMLFPVDCLKALASLNVCTERLESA